MSALPREERTDGQIDGRPEMSADRITTAEVPTSGANRVSGSRSGEIGSYPGADAEADGRQQLLRTIREVASGAGVGCVSDAPIWATAATSLANGLVTK
ncbi:hypothetical protein AXG93_1231s1090 [Marchantia polymorpha subsp. ruderalis]|uniref:Uncharacterized protein n=1 Tax=Marchantia polymorpha subsp. ruderalis TaxID=1480154 RepID=A0A176VT30_MARPO|nr:hypothetical protein AXG93_1231s1090 [Marchantia polymorpha subsp. ruderalis]